MTCVKLILCSVFVLAICHMVLTENYQGKGQDVCKECAENRSRCNVVEFKIPIENAIFQCECKTGYTGNGTTCENVDECVENLDNCDNHAKCKDTVGSFSCSCDDGWKDKDEKRPGVECDDIDECANAAMNDCGDTGTCDNNDGSYSCKCAEGYKDPPANTTKPCKNINECSEGGNNCDVNANCTDTVGSFTCTCNDGYTGNGTYCTDIDECQVNDGDCGENTLCNNTVGSFLCSCKDGFQWNENKTDCIDIDECKDKSLYKCGEHEVCNNTVGLYECPCEAGYKNATNGTCVNIDECSEGTHDCDVNATCSDTVGSFNCVCNEGYTGNGTYCEDIDECADTTTHECDKNYGKCINTVGNYTCKCIYSYTGDGYNCRRTGKSDDDLKNQAAELAERQTGLKIHTLILEWQQLQIRNEQLKRYCAIVEKESVSRQKREILPKVNQNDMQTYIKALEIHISDLKLQNHLLLVKCPGDSDEIFG